MTHHTTHVHTHTHIPLHTQHTTILPIHSLTSPTPPFPYPPSIHTLTVGFNNPLKYPIPTIFIYSTTALVPTEFTLNSVFCSTLDVFNSRPIKYIKKSIAQSRDSNILKSGCVTGSCSLEVSCNRDDAMERSVVRRVMKGV